MNRTVNLVFVLLLLIAVACSSPKGVNKSTSEVNKSAGSVIIAEDLSDFRPQYPAAENATPATRATPVNHVNNRVNVLMDTVANVNKNIKYAQGYRILAYNGSERQIVMDLRKNILNRVPEENGYLTYQQPNFRLKIGDFFTRVEAQQILNKIQDLIPNAQIVQDQITINKTVSQ
jgi:hypothetical protein